MPDIVISEFMDGAAVDTLRSSWSVEYDPGLADKTEELASLVADAKALIVRNRTQVTEALLDAGKALQCVGRLGVGLDNIDVDACRARGIEIFPAVGANNTAVAEYVIATTLNLLRGAYASPDAMVAGKWPRQKLIGREAAGKTMGLIGYGAIAREVAWRAHGLGMEIVAHDPNVEASDPAWQLARNLSRDGVLEVADVVSLHVPLNESTRRFIDKHALDLMKRGAILINSSRGGIVDENALCEALKAGHLGGAALDVFEKEPLDAEAGKAFSGIGNLILTPHIAGVTRESNVRVSQLIAMLVGRHLEKKDG